MFFHVVLTYSTCKTSAVWTKTTAGHTKKYRPAKKSSKKKNKKKTFNHEFVFFKIYNFLSTVKFSFCSTSDIGYHFIILSKYFHFFQPWKNCLSSLVFWNKKFKFGMFFHVVLSYSTCARLAQYEPKPQQGTQKKYRPAKKSSKKYQKKKKTKQKKHIIRFNHEFLFFKIYKFLSPVKFSFCSTSDIG